PVHVVERNFWPFDPKPFNYEIGPCRSITGHFSAICCRTADKSEADRRGWFGHLDFGAPKSERVDMDATEGTARYRDSQSGHRIDLVGVLDSTEVAELNPLPDADRDLRRSKRGRRTDGNSQGERQCAQAP